MNAQKLVELAMIRTGCQSARELAKLADVSNVTVSSWIKGAMCPSFEQCCELAEMAGLAPVSTAAEVRQHSVDGPKHRKILTRLAKVAACALITLGSVGVSHSQPHERAGFAAHNPGTLYIM